MLLRRPSPLFTLEPLVVIERVLILKLVWLAKWDLYVAPMATSWVRHTTKTRAEGVDHKGR